MRLLSIVLLALSTGCATFTPKCGDFMATPIQFTRCVLDQFEDTETADAGVGDDVPDS